MFTPLILPSLVRIPQTAFLRAVDSVFTSLSLSRPQPRVTQNVVHFSKGMTGKLGARVRPGRNGLEFLCSHNECFSAWLPASATFSLFLPCFPSLATRAGFSSPVLVFHSLLVTTRAGRWTGFVRVNTFPRTPGGVIMWQTFRASDDILEQKVH